jgi:hypothetical protein
MKPFEHKGREFCYRPAYDAWLSFKPYITLALAPNGQYSAVQEVRGYVIEAYGETPQEALDALEART